MSSAQKIGFNTICWVLQFPKAGPSFMWFSAENSIKLKGWPFFFSLSLFFHCLLTHPLSLWGRGTPQPCYVVHAGLEIVTVLLPQLRKCWVRIIIAVKNGKNLDSKQRLDRRRWCDWLVMAVRARRKSGVHQYQIFPTPALRILSCLCQLKYICSHLSP